MRARSRERSEGAARAMAESVRLASACRPSISRATAATSRARAPRRAPAYRWAISSACSRAAAASLRTKAWSSARMCSLSSALTSARSLASATELTCRRPSSRAFRAASIFRSRSLTVSPSGATAAASRAWNSASSMRPSASARLARASCRWSHTIVFLASSAATFCLTVSPCGWFGKRARKRLYRTRALRSASGMRGSRPRNNSAKAVSTAAVRYEPDTHPIRSTEPSMRFSRSFQRPMSLSATSASARSSSSSARRARRNRRRASVEAVSSVSCRDFR